MLSAHSNLRRRFYLARRMITKFLFRLLGPINHILQPQIKYGIKAGYHDAKDSLDFDDRNNQDEWQKEVYLFAAGLMKERNFSSVIDFGCGSGYKLVNYLGEYKTLGIDLPEITHWLQSKYPERNWVAAPLKASHSLEADLIICADTIEHIKKPDELIHQIQMIRSRLILFSTPERISIAGKNDFGPPENPSHYREWNVTEFRNWLADYFDIEDQRIFNDRSITQVIVCKKY
jgi:2-polyprenyl-3-methyl-5-hydroxy-6-metoxy-1,4-benzoquinol methylase